MPSHVDHLVVTAFSLKQGVRRVEDLLGVELQPGGEHPRMGTHNYLLRLGERVYLEVIAANPAAPRPDRPRWFGLDTLDPRSETRLTTWVARTDDIAARASASPVSLGNVERMARGALEWLITIPADGSPPLEGVVPALIQWPDGVHPASSLEDRGCRLLKLEARTPRPDRVQGVLEALDLSGSELAIVPLPAPEKPCLVAHIQTPGGVRSIGRSM